jgi:hypothetical protein
VIHIIKPGFSPRLISELRMAGLSSCPTWNQCLKWRVSQWSSRPLHRRYQQQCCGFHIGTSNSFKIRGLCGGALISFNRKYFSCPTCALCSSSGGTWSPFGKPQTRNGATHSLRPVDWQKLMKHTATWWVTKQRRSTVVIGPMAGLQSWHWLQPWCMFHSAFEQECRVLYTRNGNAALSSKDFDNAIVTTTLQYSAEVRPGLRRDKEDKMIDFNVPVVGNKPLQRRFSLRNTDY